MEDLEGLVHVVGARNARQIALHFRIQLDRLGAVGVAGSERFGGVRDLSVTFDDANASGHSADGAESHNLSIRNRNIRAGTQLQGGLSRVRLDVVVRGVHHLPDAIEVRVDAIGSTFGFPGGGGGRIRR